ncbi:NAD(P)-dependent oxidoreductase [Anaerobacillus sp. HL2]|nr:NAD(P)-dependent oxidoreductase [Anaerobacillus sp. HL2]
MAAEAVIKTKMPGELKIPYVIFSIPTIYGPWQRVDMIYTQLFLNEMMKISKEVDDDQVKEDVLYIDDILDTLIEAGNKRDCKNEIFNLSTGKINEWYRGRSLINKHQSTKPQDERLCNYGN